jgi:hypothetical protein
MTWSSSDVELLRKNWQKDYHQLMRLFPGKTKAAIRGKIYRMGYTRSDR